MAGNFIPGPDAQFDEWIANFTIYAAAHAATLGLTPAEVTEIQSANTDWHADFEAHLQAQAAARGKTEKKDGTRVNSVDIIRKMVRIIQANPSTTDEDRKNLRITVADEKRTPVSEMFVETSPAPLLRLDWSQRGRCIIHFGSNPNNERENALPTGMKGAKLWFHIGGIPANEADWKWLDDDTKSPYVHVLGGSAAQTVAYRVQYIDTRMKTGPFSDPAVATITV